MIWNVRFLQLAQHIAGWSKDRSTQVGCVVANTDRRILSVGYNGFPAGMDDEAEHRHVRPEKYMYTEHAERNAIYNATRSGVSLKGAILYSTLFPCADCARGIAQSGIAEVVVPNVPFREDWSKSFEVSQEIFRELDIIITEVFIESP